MINNPKKRLFLILCLFFCQFGLKAQSSNISSDGLVLYLDAGNPNSYSGSGSTWNDISANGNNSTLYNGVTYDSSNSGNLQFYGSSTYSETNSNVSTSLQNGYTLIQAIKLTNYNGGTFSYNDTGSSKYINFYMGGSDKMRWETYAGNSIYSNTTIPLDTWVIVVGTFSGVNSDGATGTAKFYINGVLDSSETLVSQASLSNSPITIGEYAGYMNGAVGVTMFYNRELTLNEIQDNYNFFESRYCIPAVGGSITDNQSISGQIPITPDGEANLNSGSSAIVSPEINDSQCQGGDEQNCWWDSDLNQEVCYNMYNPCLNMIFNYTPGHTAAQSFMTSTNVILKAIKIDVANINSGNYTLRIFHGDGVSGTELRNQTVSILDSGTITFPLVTSLALTANQSYTFQLETSDGNAQFYWTSSSDTDYTNGLGYVDGNNNSSDFNFQLIYENNVNWENITLSGYSGGIQKWQRATDSSFTSPIDIANTSATLASYLVGNISHTTYFRAVIVGCSNVFSDYATISVTPAPSASDQIFCGSKTIADLVATGTDLKWYNVATNGTALATSTAIASGTYYVSQTIDAIESTRTAVPVTVIINSQSVAPSIGDGTLAAPYQIANFENLLWISENNTVWGQNFIQTANIDASETLCLNGGLGWSPIGNFPHNANWVYTDHSFYGVYNGQGHTISNLYINRPLEERIGLFGRVGKYSTGLVTDVHLINVNINANDVAGAVVGQLFTKVEKSSATGNVRSAYDWAYSLGGIVGQMEGGSEISLSSANVYVSGTGNGPNNFGGFCGSNSGTISNSYALGSVTANSGAGGFVGDNTRGIITNCYSTGSAVAATNGGGFVSINTMEDFGGWSHEPTMISGTINNCFWDSETSGLATSEGGTSKTTLEMKTTATFTNEGWDFSTIWSINPLKNSGYPDFIGTDIPGIISWTGANSTTWSDSGNWSNNTVPTLTSDVTIAAAVNQPLLASDVAINSLTIDSSASLTVPSGLNLTVTNYIHNSGTMTVENNANLIQVDDVANSGNINVNRESSALYKFDYSLWSSPVFNTSQHLTDFSPLTDVKRFYNYDTASNMYKYIVTPESTLFTIGKGYLIRMPTTSNLASTGTTTKFQGVFSGVPNNGSKTYTMATDTNGYNLVGNPYPSTINIDSFITDNVDNIEGTLWFWRKTNNTSGTAYSTCTTAGFALANGASYPDGDFISVGQGFFVKAKSTTLNFTNLMRIANNQNQFFRTKAIERNRIWLNLSNASQPINQMMVAYMTGATKNIDQADGRYINDNPTALNTLINNEEYAIQARSLPFDPSDIVPMSFKTDVAGAYTIAIDHVDGLFSNDQQIFLKDNLTGVETDLKSGSYNFTAVVGVDTNRFSLLYQKTLGINTDNFSDNSVKVSKNKGNILIKSNNRGIDNVKLFDINGRLILEKSNVKANETVIESTKFGNQILIVKITSDDNKVVSVKLVN